jgi:hypothetical protein
MVSRENPFVFGEIIDDANFVNRTDELSNLVRDLADGQKVFLLSPRRFGKSSLVALALLKLVRSRAQRRLALSSADFAPLDNVASGTCPLDPFACIAAKRDVAPAVCGFQVLEDIDACHNSDSVGKVDAKWTLSQ